MPRFFDDYSNTYLTHDSAAGRKQQRRGWKFRENFKIYYQDHLDEWRSGPMGLAAAQQAYMRGRPPGDPSIPPLPQGWKEQVDEATRITYYVQEDGTRSWVRPNFFPPPPGQGGPPPSGGGFRAGQQPPPNFSRPPPSFQRGPPPPPGSFPGGPPPPPMGVPPPQFPPPGAQQLPPPPFPPPSGPPPPFPPQSS